MYVGAVCGLIVALVMLFMSIKTKDEVGFVGSIISILILIAGVVAKSIGFI
ncbi:hypothetical protein ABBZ21_19780 [Acinetobacter baumannii]|uniref:hypothetical protein n=1 Tax=Acinetobacter baumannii TaxID=470 RepID=UPI00385CDD5E